MSTEFIGPFEQEKFQMSIAGDFGIFYTDKEAPVFYLNTSFEIDNIGQLKPVREILDVSEVDFEELVQRDLDDFRIRRDIVNYLTDGMGYKFFPPIVVAVTQPEEDKKAIKKFYPEIQTRVFENGSRKSFEIEFENSFCVRWFVSPDDKLYSLPTEIRWKNDQTYLMAVDGQHRLVSLQAIRGLITNERLKQFYTNSSKDKSKLDNLKVPVTILFFPNSVENIGSNSLDDLNKYFPKIAWELSNKANVKQVLRNIFVDVNKTAKQPSKSRTILLDEKDLTAVFTRKVFSSIKSEIPNIYTALLEYNSVNGKETQIEKNRCLITTIGIVHGICEYLFKDSAFDTGANLRIRLGIDEEDDFPNSEEFPSDKVKSNEFSLEQREFAESIFKEKWLHTFNQLYTSFIPFKKMIDNVETEYTVFKKRISDDNLNPNENEAYRVLFGGSEERFILESNSKSVSNTSAKASLKILKDTEKNIKSKVENYSTFYTLMFQRGFFEALSKLIQEGFFSEDHYVSSDEFLLILEQLNNFIEENSENTFFNNGSSLYNLIIGSKATPDASKHIGDLIVLILLKYSPDSNSFLIENEFDEQLITRTANNSFDSISKRMQTLLGKEFDSQTQNKQRKLDIKLEKEKGHKLQANKLNSEYNLDRDNYILEAYKINEVTLKELLNL